MADYLDDNYFENDRLDAITINAITIELISAKELILLPFPF